MVCTPFRSLCSARWLSTFTMSGILRANFEEADQVRDQSTDKVSLNQAYSRLFRRTSSPYPPRRNKLLQLSVTPVAAECRGGSVLSLGSGMPLMSLLCPDLVQVPCIGLARRPCLVEPDLGSYRPSKFAPTKQSRTLKFLDNHNRNSRTYHAAMTFKFRPPFTVPNDAGTQVRTTSNRD